MTSLPIDSIPSSLFQQHLIQGVAAAVELLPHYDDVRGYAQRRSQQGASRQRLAALVRRASTAMLSSAQEHNLQLLLAKESVVVVTGQQVGFLGGPLYTVLKIASAVARARQFSESLGLPVVPMFWLEDNDHDTAEAATAYLPDAAGTLASMQLLEDTDGRIPVWRRTVDANQWQQAKSIATQLQGSEAFATSDRISNAYAEGTSWSQAMMSMLQPYLAAWGVLAIRGSHIVAEGLHQPIIMAEAENPGRTLLLVEQANEELRLRGYHEQARASDYTFMIDVNGERHRPVITNGTIRLGSDDVSNDDIRNYAQTQSEKCSPGVLLRPIVQDAVLPSIASVLGGAEAAYNAQLPHVYAAYGIEQPLALLRHSATVLDSRTERLLDKMGLPITNFMHSMSDVEQSIVALASAHVVPNVSYSPLIEAWRDAAMQVDATLAGSVASADAAIAKALEQLAGKIRSAVKRKQTEAIERARAIAGIVYPAGTLQERKFPLAWYEARFGIDTFRKIAEAICAKNPADHWIIRQSDVEDHGTLTESKHH